uniref:Uncharacterized protein n=1 Tax=Romanomermis culicivorax TaxID=13658 RepID=A0A915IQQ6_ROMCU
MATNFNDFWKCAIFNRFWQTYYHTQAWSQHYLNGSPINYRTFSEAFSSRCTETIESASENGQNSGVSTNTDLKDLLILMPPPPPPPLHCCPHRKKNKRRQNSKKRRKSRQNRGTIGDEVIVIPDMTIDPGFVEFLSHSLKHRLERQKSRNESESWLHVFDEYMPIDKIGINTRSVHLIDSLMAPTGDYEEIRSENLRKLYGVHARNILDLECSIQTQFDAYFDKYHPPLWPNMPLKL